jgi:hypothetical protein
MSIGRPHMAGTCEAGGARVAALGVAGFAGALPAAVGDAVVRRDAGLLAVGTPLLAVLALRAPRGARAGIPLLAVRVGL